MQPSIEWNKGYAFALLLGALVLLGVGTAGLEGRLLLLSAPGGRPPPPAPAAVDQYAALFVADPVADLVDPAKRRDVFFTSHFTRPAPPVAPASPKTRRAALTYLGTVSSSTGERLVFLRVDQKMMKLGAGSLVIEDWRIAEAAEAALVLTNNAAQQNRLAFRQTLQLEVPIR